MWNPGILCRPPAGLPHNSHSGAMAHRRCLISRQVAATLGACLVMGLGLVGLVTLANQVINIREDIAVLEDRREFLEACQARSLARLIAARSPVVIVARAVQELGLVVSDDPDLALVMVSPDDKAGSHDWQHLIDGLGGGEVAWANAGQATAEAKGSAAKHPGRRMHE